jgi:hypothetical protein
MTRERDDPTGLPESMPAPPTGADIAGPGMVRQGTGYSGTSSGGVEAGAGHDPEEDGPATEGYMGGTTSPNEPGDEVIALAAEGQSPGEQVIALDEDGA